MKYIYILTVSVLLASCTNVEGWKARLNNGVYVSESGEFQVENPIDSGFCLKVEDSLSDNSETVGFRECHGYIAEHYGLTWYKVETMSEDAFYEKTERSFIPRFAKDIFNPIDEGVLVSSSRERINGKPAIVFIVKTKTGKEQLMLKSTSILYGDRVLSISVGYDMSKTDSWIKPGSDRMFDIYNKFVSSFVKN
ncbi:hypothetical protein [Vibrio mangrovi]|uniref:Lipoprotein n=1 Tax=Vibrio mangrovi TaxID=474394 RepID=A0A1Y6ISJ2_9VIBR|nr:hypothetical protein [Vibrio mangrovi]MDW6003734.1 hypothetical protein [Vibrio mangrovi]SMR99472.1 hypothetical protein VIM7927_00697 [Vibrio mangrovi]